MNWATDQLGRLLQASEGGFLSYGLRCPNCGEPVFRRAGGQRRPHFAHFGFSAKPDCELYYPAVAGGSRFASSNADAMRSVSRSGGVFLSARTGGAFELLLRLPRLESPAGVSGEIQLQTALGTKVVSAESLVGKQFIRLVPAIPLVDVVGSGALVPLAEAIRLDASQFKEGRNFFRAGQGVGRLLQPQEPLECGLRYYFLGRNPLPPAPYGTGVSMGGTLEVRGWHFCTVDLPASREEEFERLGILVGSWLGRTILPTSLRVWPIDPPPHHIEPDGTLVFADETRRILIRRSSAFGTVALAGEGALDWTRVAWTSEEWGQLEILSRGEAGLFADGREQFAIRVDSCPRFDPAGIQVETDSERVELFDPLAAAAATRALPGALLLGCPSERVASRLEGATTVWSRHGRKLEFKGTGSQWQLDAGGFGELRAEVESVADPVPAVDLRNVWLEGVVFRLKSLAPAASPPGSLVGACLRQGLASRTDDIAWLRIYRNAAVRRYTRDGVSGN